MIFHWNLSSMPLLMSPMPYSVYTFRYLCLNNNFITAVVQPTWNCYLSFVTKSKCLISALGDLQSLFFFYYLVERFKTLGNAKINIVTHHFITLIVQNLNALINVTKGPLIYEQYFIILYYTFYLFGCLQWPTWSLTSNYSKILMHYPLLIQFWFALSSVSNSSPTFLFIYQIYFTLA